MNATELKSDLHKLIDKISDLNLSQAIKVILLRESENDEDRALRSSNDLIKELEASIEEANQNKTISHDEALRQIKKRYSLN